MSQKLFLLISIVFIFGPPTIHAQSDPPKLELGVHGSALRFSDFSPTEPGIGGRVTYNANSQLAVEAEFTSYPRNRRTGNNQVIPGQARKTQGLFGVKYGIRGERWGLFSKFRPGFVRFDSFALRSDVVCLAVFPPAAGCLTTQTNFAFDVGGVLEFYPARPVVLRFDLGNTIIRYRSPGYGGDFTSNNPQINVGLGLRF